MKGGPVKPDICAFCGQPSYLLCDGDVSPAGQVTHRRTCDKPICRACAGQPIALVHGIRNGRRHGDTRDLCPDCRAAARTTTIGAGR
jgi:hypothetical protein